MKLRIEKAIYGGAGLARADGKVIFVPYTLPGELVEAELQSEKKSFAEAALTRVLESASARAEPPCPYFGVCGGCHYQHATYAEQITMKVAILREALERAGLRDLPEIAPVFAAPLGYRNRIRLHIDRASSALCYKVRGSHRNLPVVECPIAVPLLQETLRAAGSLRLGEHFDEVELFTNANSSELLLSLWARNPASGFDSRLAEIARALPGVTGAAVFAARPVQGRPKRISSLEQDHEPLDGRPLAQWGRPAITYHAAGEQYRVSAGAFFQGNTHLVDDLVALATSGARGRTAWDLYAGVGLFARVLAQSFAEVIAVEGAGPSFTDLKENLALPGHRAVQSGILEFLSRPLRERPDFVLVDPPRAGLGPEVTSLLSRIGPQQITYVSCDPATLSRDLTALVSSGYQILNLHMVDLFPQTYHLETVAQLSLT